MALILVIEHDREYSALLKDYLEQIDHKVLVATTGLEALEFLISKRMPIDLILIDENMPKIKDSVLAQVIRKQLDPAPPYIFVTGETKVPLEEIKHATILHKPLSFDDLRDSIARSLEQKNGSNSQVSVS